MSVFERQGSKLVGVGGTNHSGKDSAGEHLASEHGFMHISISDVLRAEACKQGLDMERPTLIEIGVRLREEHGPGVVVLRGIEQWQEKRERFLGGLVLSSIRVIGEAEEIIKQRGTLLFVDAPAELRYACTTERLRGDETFTSFEEYVEQEKFELEGLGGPTRPHLRAVQSMANATIMNTSSLDDYYRAIDKELDLPFH